MSEVKCDFFISYAHNDMAWVLDNLYGPLSGCEYATGNLPDVFIDKEKDIDNIPHGTKWKENLEWRIDNCSVFIPVFSTSYFKSKYCQGEIHRFISRLVVGESNGTLLPLVIDPHCQVPDYLGAYQSRTPIKDHEAQWFEQLCKSLKVTPRKRKETPQFEAQVSHATVGLTLTPPVRVRVLSDHAPISEEFEVTLEADRSELLGDVTVKTSAGIAEFRNLLLGRAAKSVRLTASGPGLNAVKSQSFDVLLPPVPQQPITPPTIPVEGEAMFFASGKSVLVIRFGAVGIYDLTGKPLLPETGEVAFTGRPRLIRRSGRLIVLADWTGNIFLFDERGSLKTFAFDPERKGLIVPADVAFDNSTLYVGFWSGLVFRMSQTDLPKQVLYHPAGVQALTVANGRYYICDFSGALAVYNDAQKLVNTATIEPSVWLLKNTPDGLLAIGDTAVYQIHTKGFEVLREDIPFDGITEVLVDSACPVLMNDRGQGLRVTSNLTFRQQFHVALGTVPYSADDACEYCILANNDDSRTLLRGDRVIFNHMSGTLAISAAGDHFAIGEPGGIRILNSASFEKLLVKPTT